MFAAASAAADLDDIQFVDGQFALPEGGRGKKLGGGNGACGKGGAFEERTTVKAVIHDGAFSDVFTGQKVAGPFRRNGAEGAGNDQTGRVGGLHSIKLKIAASNVNVEDIGRGTVRQNSAWRDRAGATKNLVLNPRLESLDCPHPLF